MIGCMKARHWLAALALLAGCQAPAGWQKDGASAAMVQADSDECRSQARTAPLPMNLPTQPSPSMTEQPMDRTREVGTQDTQMFQRCMEKKGYSAKR
jgi:hypothetical protein